MPLNKSLLPQRPKQLGNNIFYTDADLETIEKSIETFCSQLPADFEFQNKYKCVYYSHYTETTFHINIYVDNDVNDKYIIEVQRIGGDAFGFVDVIRAARYFFPNLKDTTKLGNLQSLVYKPPVIEVEVDVKETIKHIFFMTSSDFCDVQSEALTVLANMSSQKKVQEEICLNGLKLLLQRTKSRVPTVHRCAIAILANVFESQNIKQNELYPELKSSIQQLSLESTTPQVLRDCVRCLASIEKM